MVAALQSAMFKTILVTGFEPFAAATSNPSKMVVEQLAMFEMTGVRLISKVLPVEFTKATQLLLDLMADIKPDVVIALGQAEGRSDISIERMAINLADAKIPDNAGIKLTNQTIETSGAAGYFSTLPVEELVLAVNESGIKCSQSLSAGSFVCNYIFYQMQHALKNTKVISGFIHLPLVPQQQLEFPDKPTMPLVEMVDALKAIILNLHKRLS